MSTFWKGFFSIFDFGSKPIDYKKYVPKPMKWYHDGPWWEHPIYGDGFKKKDRD